MTTDQTTARTPYIIEPAGGTPVIGQGVRIKASSEQTGGQASVLEVFNPGFGGPPLHVHHRHDEMFYVVEGEYLFQIGEDMSVGRAGTFAFFPRGIPHTFASRGEAPGRLLNIGLPSGLEGFVHQLDHVMAEAAGQEEIQRVCAAWDTELVGPPLSPP
jgi:mannose-6-phosphate isomerase-like protein (cupin superfamily)